MNMGVDTLMDSVLEVYFPQCRYLKSVNFHYPEIRGEFGISSSCYIKSTGHFNAVEAIICYNQLAYTFFAHGIDERVEELMKLETLSFEDFSRNRQLPDSYIVDIRHLKFRKPINSSKFYGDMKLNKASKVGSSAAFFLTGINFWDDGNGKASGEFLLAFVPRQANIHPHPNLSLVASG